VLSSDQSRPGRWTVADIGGTHARLATWSAADGLGAPRVLRNDDFPGPVDLLSDWFRDTGDDARRVVLALAMPIGGDARQLTNRAWRFDPRGLIEALHLDALVLVNDFAAAAAGIDALPPEAMHPLNPGASPVPGARLVLGPGTGLGSAVILRDVPPRIIASEAGHVTFGSAADEAPRLLAEGRARWGRVSWERVLSGDGLQWLHETRTGHALRSADIAHAAGGGQSDARASVALFSRLLGEFAGDMCLAFQATEGVYLCGGVLGGLRRSFDAAAFLAAFVDKGRFTDQLRRVPVHFAAGHELGLHGAARFLAGQCRMPSMEWNA
jgi:glucokinase